MCIPVFPNTNHPSRSPIQPDKPLPWPNCYHASFEKMTFRVRTAHMNSTSATRLPPSQVELHLEAIMDDEDRVEELKQAAPPLHDTELPIPAPEKQDIKCVLAEQEASPSISSRSISASIISAIDDDEALDEDERMANRPPLKMPLIQMSYDLSTVGEVADPQDLFAEVEAIKQYVHPFVYLSGLSTHIVQITKSGQATRTSEESFSRRSYRPCLRGGAEDR